MNAGRERLLKFVHLGDDCVRNLQRVGRGILEHAESDDLGVGVEAQSAGVILRAELYARHVGKANVSAVRSRAQNDVAELRGVGELRQGVDRVGMLLAIRLGRGSDAAGRDLGVLLVERVDDVADVEALLLELLRVQPDAHRILPLAEDADLRDAGRAGQVIDDVELGVVAQKQRVVLLRIRLQRDAHDERTGVLADGNADLLYRLRQLPERRLDEVLNVGRSDVEVDAEVERTGDRRYALAAGRTDVAQPLNGVHGLFERRRDLRFDCLRARADVRRRDGDDRRSDLRVLRDGHRRNDHQAGDHDDQRTDRRQHRAV